MLGFEPRYDASLIDQAPELIYQTSLKGGLTPSDLLETQQVFVPSKDGTKVPMFIVSCKGAPLNGDNPTLLYGYGGKEAEIGFGVYG